VAYKFKGEEKEALFKPPIPIEIEAMAVSHITNRMVEDKDIFVGSLMQKELEEIFGDENILVAHNAIFDVEMLERENLKIGKKIDTHKIAQYLDKEGEISKYSLQYLRYYFDLDVQNATAHNALGDVRVLEKLFDNFFEKMMAEFGEEEKVIEKMIEISEKPILIKKFNFGKYNGERVSNVFQIDARYLKWLLDEKIKTRDQGGDNDENWIYTLEYYLKR
jgi:DNA polymerase III epsilon subunit-like protein